jgi:hypothetical protein
MKTWFLVLGLLSASMAAGCGSPSWKEFAPSQGRFRVLMPGTPVVQEESEDTWAGLARGKRYLASTGSGGTDSFCAYGVTYADYPERYTQTKSPEKILAGQKDALVPSEGKLLKERPIEIGSSPGIELELEDPAGKILFFRIYLVEKRLYVVTAKYAKGKRTPEVDAFFESFRLTND